MTMKSRLLRLLRLLRLITLSRILLNWLPFSGYLTLLLKFRSKAIQENNGSSWELDFYKSVRVPWKKILAAKNFMYCHESVVKWDDSAAVEAFHDAKRRYWEKINCLPCETPLPDKDMYINEINWNPYINPKLISDLDREYFNPDEVEKADTSQTSVVGRNNTVPVCVPVQNDEKHDEFPWGRNAAQGIGTLSETLNWGQNTKLINSEDVTHPWEHSCTLVDKSLKNNAWKGLADKGTQEVGNCWIQTAKSIDSRDANNPWEQSLSQFDESSTANAWKGYAGVDPRGVQTRWDLNSKSINLEELRTPWEQSCSQFADPLKNNAWKGSACESPTKRVGTHSGQYADSMNPKDVNPWEQSCTPVDESLWNNAGKGCPGESWQWRKESTYNSWSAENAGDKRRVHVDDRSRGQKQWNISSHKQQYPVNTENTWQRHYPSHFGVSCGRRGWTEHGHNSGDWKQPEIHDKRSKNVNYKGPFGGGRVEQSGCRKREGSLQHSPRHKTSRLQGHSYMREQKWQ